MRYIIIAHSWFVSSKGFDVIESDATTKEQAQKEAYAFKGENDSTFRSVAVKVIEIKDKETIDKKYESKLAKHNKLRKVSFSDWLFGRIAKFE